VEFFKRDVHPQIQFANIASGTFAYTEGAILVFVRLLNFSIHGVREQAVWALGKICAMT